MSKNVRDIGKSKLSVSTEEKALSNEVDNLILTPTQKTNNNIGYAKNNPYPKTVYHVKGYGATPSAKNFDGDRNGYVRDSLGSRHRGSVAEEPPEWTPPPEILASLQKENIFPLKKKSARFVNAKYFCRSCEYHCDTVEVCTRHSQDSRHIYMKEIKLLENVLRNFPPPTFEQAESLSQLINSEALAQVITEEEIKVRKEIKNELEKLLLEAVPGSGLEISGSTLSGFALTSSNLDLDVIVPEDIKPATALFAILKIIEKDDRYCDNVNDLCSSFPCLSFTHKVNKVRMVVGVSSPPARNTNILFSQYCSLDDRVKPLVIAFRFWAKLCQIDNQHRGTLPAHCFPLMVIHFLQQVTPPVLPVLHALTPSTESEKYLHPDKMDPPWKSLNKSSLGQLWIDLFYFYSITFKMAVYAINVRSVEPVARKEKTWGKRMAIEDPFQIKRNLTRSVSSPSVFDYIINRIKTTYRYFATPQLDFGGLFKQVEREMKLSTSAALNSDEKLSIECLLRKGKVVDGDDAEDEDISEDEDDSTCEELDDDDDEASVIKPLEDSEETSSSSSPVEGTQSSNDSSLDEEEIIQLCDVKNPFEKVSYKVAKRLMEQIKREQFQYSFAEKNFTDGKKVPLFCSACRKNGHDKSECKEDELPPLKPLPALKPHYLKRLTHIFQDLRNECAPTPKEIEDRDFIVRDLEGFIRHFYMGATLKLFGSSANGFGFGHSDLDICLTFEGHPTGEKFNYIQVIEEIAERLKKFRPVHQVLAITTAKVPIVKFAVRTGRRMQLEADLSLYNTLALQNTQLLNTYANIDPRVKILGYAIKYFAKLCDMGDASRGSLSSYAYILIVIHFLQQCTPPVIPVLQMLHEPTKNPPELCIDGWNAWFFSDLKNLPKYWEDYGKNKQSPGELWVNMLRYYTETFNWKDNVITIRQHEPLSRLMKLWTTQCIAIEDPFDLSHNLGAGLSRKMNTYIMKAFIKGREMFGSGYEAPPVGQGYRDLVEFLFDTHQLTDGAPPNDRGCRFCGKIGHMVKECPRKKQRRDPKKDVPKESNIKEDAKISSVRVKNEKEQVSSSTDSSGPTAQETVLQNLPKDLVATETLAKRISEDETLNASVSAIKDTQRSVSTPQNNLSKAETSKGYIDPNMLFHMANKFGGGTIQLPGSSPINLNPVCSNIPSGSPVSPLLSCSSPVLSHRSDILSLSDISLPNPPPGFTQSSSAVQRSPLIHPSDNLSALRSATTASPSQPGMFSDSPKSVNPSLTTNAFETLCRQKQPRMQVLNSQQQHIMNEQRQRQMFLQQQQQIRLQEQQYYMRMQQQQYLFQINQQQLQYNMQQQPPTREMSSHTQFQSSRQVHGEQKSMDGKAFISHLMDQVSTRINPQGMPGLPPPPGLGPTSLSQMGFSLTMPVPNQQQQFHPVSRQTFPDFVPSDNTFQLRKSCSEEVRPFSEGQRTVGEGTPGQMAKSSNPVIFLTPNLASPSAVNLSTKPSQETHEAALPSDFFYMDKDSQ